MLQVVLLLAIGIAVFVLLGYVGGRIARRSRRDRRTAMWIFALSFVAGLVIALWLPHRLPLTEGSAATMVAILILWADSNFKAPPLADSVRMVCRVCGPSLPPRG